MNGRFTVCEGFQSSRPCKAPMHRCWLNIMGKKKIEPDDQCCIIWLSFMSLCELPWQSSHSNSVRAVSAVLGRNWLGNYAYVVCQFRYVKRHLSPWKKSNSTVTSRQSWERKIMNMEWFASLPSCRAKERTIAGEWISICIWSAFFCILVLQTVVYQYRCMYVLHWSIPFTIQAWWICPAL